MTGPLRVLLATFRVSAKTVLVLLVALNVVRLTVGAVNAALSGLSD